MQRASGLDIGRNRLTTGFPSTAPVNAPSPASLESGETQDEVIAISSDSEEDSAGGMVINVEDEMDNEDEDDGDESKEEGETDDSQAAISISSSSNSFSHDDSETHIQLQGNLERHLSNDFEPLSLDVSTKKEQLGVRLADLDPDELESQLKYALFHLDRQQIDLNRLAICIACLKEGHADSQCPERQCRVCGQENLHSIERCPAYRRCLKCRERGHDADTCPAKLKESAVPCDICGSKEHMEDTCAIRFFPASKVVGDGNVKLWVSCCGCGSKSHLIGDCPSYRGRADATRWSLRNLNPSQIINMSLESGMRRMETEAENRNMRPQGLSIRGRAERDNRGQGSRRDDYYEDDDDPFIRAPVRQNQPGNIRFDRDRRHRDDYSPPRRGSPIRSRHESPRRYDRYEAPSDIPSPNNRSRGDWYQSDSFGHRRSRSPNNRQDYRRPVNDYAPPGTDRWQPPLPREPPPGPGRGHGQSQKKGRPKYNDQPPPEPRQGGGESYLPMPSSAKQAWDRHRL